MATTGRGVDFINIDGGEGGTGAAPLIFTDSVSLPFRVGFSRVYAAFAERGLQDGRGVRRRRQAGPPRQRRRGLRPRLRPGERRAGGDAGHRLHPGPAMPHRPLPHRRGDPGPLAVAGRRPDAQVGAGRQLRQDAAARPAEGVRSLRRRAPGPHRHRGHRAARSRTPLHAAARALRLPTRLGAPIPGRPSPSSPTSWPPPRHRVAPRRPRPTPWADATKERSIDATARTRPGDGAPGRRPTICRAGRD